MVANGDSCDKRPIMSNGLVVKYCPYYIYLGAYIIDDGNYKSSIDLLTIRKNTFWNLSLSCKGTVIFRLTSKEGSLRHAYFQLFCIAVKPGAGGKLKTIYMSIIKMLLAVRQASCNDMYLVEYDMPSLKALVRQRQHTHFTEKLRILQDDSPANTASYRIINDIMPKNEGNISENISRDIQSTKRTSYLSMNPLLTSPKV